MLNRQIHVLLIEDNPDDVRLISELLSELREGSFQLDAARRLSEALDKLGDSSSDVVLLDWMLPDSQGQDSLKALAGRFPQIPVVVLTRLEDEDTVLASLKSGAQDYLIKGKLTSELLDHALTFAIRRHKLLMAEFQSLSAVSKPPRTPLTAVMFGVTSLKTELPDVFQTFQKEYMGVLEMVLEERAYKVEHDVTEGLRSIAERLGYIKATPRDVVDVHSAALKELTDRASFQKVEALVKEGRWTLLQLMGYLASYYRNYSLGGIRSAAPQHGAGEDLEEESQDDGAR